jgi:hypothetical protein
MLSLRRGFLSDANSVYELDEMDDSLNSNDDLGTIKTKRQIKSTHAKSNVVACDNERISQDEFDDGYSCENLRHLRPNQLSR